jgi:ribonuclease BN (tRNA processing enzyme)
MTKVSFLGTGNYLARERYWNGFVIDSHILVEPSPAVVPHMRRCGIDSGGIEVVVISHFHADHTFGWPFLLLELMLTRSGNQVSVVGPPGVEGFLESMMELAGVPDILVAAHQGLDLRFVQVDESWQTAGPLRFRAVKVEHVPHLTCFGYLFERDGSVLGYSGDTRPCSGLSALAEASGALILECNGPHAPPASHMTGDDVVALREQHRDLPLVLTHLGEGHYLPAIAGCRVPNDFETIEI